MILLHQINVQKINVGKKIAKQGDGQNQMPNQDESNLDDKIKWLDFITMIISFVCFITFASLYWIILILEKKEKVEEEKSFKNHHCTYSFFTLDVKHTTALK